jgi:hypothetical protein
MLRLLLVLTPLALGLAPLAQAQAPRGSMVCAPTVALKATVAGIAADPAAWLGKCVTVSAIYNDERLYADLKTAKAKGTFIGGYVDGRGSMEGFHSGAFTGRVSDCDEAQKNLDLGLLRSPGISLNDRVLGCIDPSGPFLLFMSQGELKKVG